MLDIPPESPINDPYQPVQTPKAPENPVAIAAHTSGLGKIVDKIADEVAATDREKGYEKGMSAGVDIGLSKAERLKRDKTSFMPLLHIAFGVVMALAAVGIAVKGHEIGEIFNALYHGVVDKPSEKINPEDLLPVRSPALELHAGYKSPVDPKDSAFCAAIPASLNTYTQAAMQAQRNGEVCLDFAASQKIIKDRCKDAHEMPDIQISLARLNEKFNECPPPPAPVVPPAPKWNAYLWPRSSTYNEFQPNFCDIAPAALINERQFIDKTPPKDPEAKKCIEERSSSAISTEQVLAACLNSTNYAAVKAQIEALTNAYPKCNY